MATLIDKFSSKSGFKVLAMARLSQVEYSVVLYLINCAASNLSEVITTDVELSSLVGYDESEVRKAIDNLVQRNIIIVRYGTPHHNPDKDSVRIGLQFDITTWKLGFESNVTSKDAVVFPFRRSGQSHLQILSNDDLKKEKEPTKSSTFERVMETFTSVQSIDSDEIETNEQAARMLVETHPVDQVLLMIRHFKNRIPTLSLLASSWQHFQELFEDETQRVDILDARQKHDDLDEKLRDAARAAFETIGSEKISEEERTVLDILIKHRHPRRQLFWAYQSRSRYPNLTEFFNQNASLMLAVTTTGKILKRNKNDT